MEITFFDGSLTLKPETVEDRMKLIDIFGVAREKPDTRGNHEATKTYGFAVNWVKGSMEIEIKDAWWNYDD